MKFIAFSTIAIILAPSVLAEMHYAGICVDARARNTEKSYDNYEVNPEATRCACEYYKQRVHGNQWFNSCPDCYYDGYECTSEDWHIGGDELKWYCVNMCHAVSGSIADDGIPDEYSLFGDPDG